MATNFHLAPPPKTVDGLATVPIVIQTIDAVFVFGGAVVVGLKIAVPRDAEPDQVIRLHFVQRSPPAQRVVGGVAAQINVVKPDEMRVTPREKTL